MSVTEGRSIASAWEQEQKDERGRGDLLGYCPSFLFPVHLLGVPFAHAKERMLKKKKNVTPAKLDTKFPGPRDQKMV